MASHRLLLLALVGATGTFAAPGDAHAQLPSPKDLASGLDLECYRTPGPALNINLNLSHLNPVLIALGLPTHNVWIRELEQTCVPVRKFNQFPPPSALPFVEQIDFACFRLEAAPLPNPQPLLLTHLNPVFVGLPQHGVQLVRPDQLCVPIYKNNTPPPPAIRQLVQFLDLECWETNPGPHPQFGVQLWQLNPQLQNIPPHPMQLVPEPRRLCVPVRKGQQQIPDAIRDRIQWIDLEQFKANPNVMVPPTNVVLRHLNPAFVNLPPIPVVLQEATSLMVPVAKNNQIPPND